MPNRQTNAQRKGYWKRVQEFFFRAMVEGWAASSGSKIQIPLMPGYKAIQFKEGKLMLLDRWCVGKDLKKSAGTTTIWDGNVPVWVMNYGGMYKESAIPFVQLALYEAYLNEVFYGGRGSRYWKQTENGPIYINNLNPGSDFLKFSGREEVFGILPGGYDASHDVSLGYHEYWGMSLL